MTAYFANSPKELLSTEDLARLDGFEFVDGIRTGRFPHPPIAKVLGFELVDAERGSVTFSGSPPFDAYNPLGGTHGGWYGTVLDSCMACAVQTTLPRGRSYTTLEYKINILRPARSDMPPLSAIGTVESSGQRIATAVGRLVDETGKTYALGTTTCLIFDI